MAKKVISANRLADGLVVYLTEDGRWVERIENAWAFDPDLNTDDARAAADNALARQHIVDPQAIEVGTSDGHIRPTRFRELIRAQGPTVRRDLGQQASSISNT